jgi:hypothetical protein
MFKASGCGRLGRQAADRPWSALRAVKAAEKTAQRPRRCSEPKQQLCIQNGTRAHYLNYLQKREGEVGKRSAGNRIGSVLPTSKPFRPVLGKPGTRPGGPSGLVGRALL